LPHCEKQDHNIPSLGTNQPRLSVLVSFSPKEEKVFLFLKKITEQKKIYTFTRGDPLTFFFVFIPNLLSPSCPGNMESNYFKSWERREKTNEVWKERGRVLSPKLVHERINSSQEGVGS